MQNGKWELRRVEAIGLIIIIVTLLCVVIYVMVKTIIFILLAVTAACVRVLSRVLRGI